MVKILKPAAFLDRDGVINRDTGYVHRWEEFELLPGAIEALQLLSESGYTIVVVTNQSGIGRGYYSVAEFHALMRRLTDICSESGISLHYYFCPHAPIDNRVVCSCRKPHPGMFIQASYELDIDLPNSIMIGDRLSDMEAAFAATVPRRFLIGGQSLSNNSAINLVTACFDTLNECVKAIATYDLEICKNARRY